MLLASLFRGYNTEDERQAAQKIPGLLTINLKQFTELLQWGVVMGVCAHLCFFPAIVTVHICNVKS